jgi:Mn2+/Fe2+ NRAMP family transporter
MCNYSVSQNIFLKTSVSFVRTFHPWIDKHYRFLISFLIIFSTAVFIGIGKPVEALVMAGALNGLILPIALALVLLACRKRLDGGLYYELVMFCIGKRLADELASYRLKPGRFLYYVFLPVKCIIFSL